MLKSKIVATLFALFLLADLFEIASADVTICFEQSEIDPDNSVNGFFSVDILALVTPNIDGEVDRWVGMDLPFAVGPEPDSRGSVTFIDFAQSNLGFDLISVDDSRSSSNEYFFSAAILAGLHDPIVGVEFQVATLYFQLSDDAEGGFSVSPLFPAVDGPVLLGGIPSINPITGEEDPTQLDSVYDIETTFKGGGLSVLSAVPEPSGATLLLLSLFVASGIRTRKN